MNDITEKPYAKFLESAIAKIAFFDPDRIIIAAMNKNGDIVTTYYACSPVDLAAISGTIDQDAIMARIENNADWLRDLLDDEETEDEDETL